MAPRHGGARIVSRRLRAGVARVPLDPPLGVPLFGYGAREGTARAVHDPLDARALYLEGATPLLWIEADLCLLAPDQARAVRARIAARTGIDRERILLGCIHTHSGPEPGFVAWLGRARAAAYVGTLLARIEAAGVRAVESAAPARLGTGAGRASIGINRRRPDGPVDPVVRVVRVDRAGGDPLAVLFLHGCHPTVLGHENLDYSADWPGAARRRVEAALPGTTALFALSAHGDVDPRTRGVHDLAVEGQSTGAGFDEMETLGEAVGSAAVEVAGSLVTRSEADVEIASTRLGIPVHGAQDGEATHREHLETLRRDAFEALGLPANEDIPTGELFARIGPSTQDLPVPERRERIARVRRYLRDRTAPRFAGGPRPEVEIQTIRLGDLRLVAIPAEPTVDVSRDWEERMDGTPAAVVSIANGWLRYLPHPTNYREPGAHLTYEVLMSTLRPSAATEILDAAETLLGSGRGG